MPDLCTCPAYAFPHNPAGCRAVKPPRKPRTPIRRKGGHTDPDKSLYPDKALHNDHKKRQEALDWYDHGGPEPRANKYVSILKYHRQGTHPPDPPIPWEAWCPACWREKGSRVPDLTAWKALPRDETAPF